MSQLLVGLNEGQRAAVAAPDGPVMVLAGPGSGKTRVLTHRIAYLIQEKNIAPWRIMAVTFTNKAAREMKERIGRIMGEEMLRGLTVGTFHSTCARILRREVADHLPGYTRDFVIFDTDDQKAAVKQAMLDLNIDDKKYNPNNIRSGISKAKNALVLPRDYQSTNFIGEVIGRVYRRYQEILMANNAMDFDDLLMNTVVLFDRAPEVTARYQQQYQHVLIDEFQDTNLTQYGIVSRLVGDNNIFIVGDADQSIYKWRGADIRNLLRFREDFPGATEILLEQNYRSTQLILDAAKEVIKRNQNRTHKELFTDRLGGEKILLSEAYNDLEEADRVVSAVKDLMLEGYNPGDFAVMYRTNAQSRSIEDGFVRAGIPYKLVGATRFYNRREIKDLIAYLRMIHNQADEFSLSRVINVPKRSIGAKTVGTLRQWASTQGWQPAEALLELAKDMGLQHPFTSRAYKSLAGFGRLLQNWVDLRDQVTVGELLDTILAQTDYKGYLVDGTDEGDERWANVVEFRNVAIVADEMPLSDFLEEVALVADVDNLEEGQEAATLLTLHASKGLEFPVVFIVGVEEGIMPHSRSIGSDDQEELAEERRLFYVGITRAKDRLFISHAFQRMSWGRMETASPSRFLNDLPAELVIGGNARSRRSSSKQRASSWSWDSGGRSSSSGAGSRASSRSRASNNNASSRKQKPQQQSFYRQDTDRYAPKSRKTTQRIPSADEVRSRSLPQPNQIDFDEEETTRSAKQTEPAFRAGDKVSHKKFGNGIVVSSRLTGSDEEVTVAFEGAGIKKLAASIAKLDKR